MDGEDFKEVCAYYGAAMYFAQCLEHGIANAMIFLDLIPRTEGKWTDEEYENYYAANFDKTLGNLIKALKSVSTLPADLEVKLIESRSKRAYLAHHFFREAMDMLAAGKYEEVIQTLENYRSFFEETDQSLDKFVMPVMIKSGFTEERMQQALKEYNELMKNGS